MRRQPRDQWDTRWRGLSRLQTGRQFVATLAIASLVTLIALLAGAYLALRNQTLAEEQARLTHEAAIASAMMSNNVQTLASSPQASADLSDRISAMTGDDAALFQYNGQSLVAVAAHNMDIVGAPLHPLRSQPSSAPVGRSRQLTVTMRILASCALAESNTPPPIPHSSTPMAHSSAR